MHMKRCCPEKIIGDDNDDVSDLVIQMIEVEDDDIEENNMQLPEGHIDMLGDARTQVHLSLSSPHHNHRNGNGIVKMVNRATSKIYQKDNCVITDEVGNDLFLVSRRVDEGITTPIILLTQLMTEGWKIKSGYSSNQRFICILKDGTRLAFVENRSNLCYLRAKIIDEVVINNHVTQEPCKVLPVVRDDEDSYDDSMPKL